MLSAYIISKDRACQLHALLSSLPNYWFDNIYVQYTYSDKDYGRAYFKLQDMFPKVNWVSETNRCHDFIYCLESMKTELFCFLTDDCVFYRQSLAKRNFNDYITEKMAVNPDIICFSLRYGRNTVVQDYKTGRIQPAFVDLHTDKRFFKLTDNEFIHDLICKWDWTKHNSTDNYGYWAGQDGHIFRTQQFIDIAKEMNFGTFRSLEGVLAGDWRYRFVDQPYMLSFHKSCVVNIPTNNVQYPPIPHSEKYFISTDRLNKDFLDGKVIRLDKMDFSNVCGSHQEIEIIVE